MSESLYSTERVKCFTDAVIAIVMTVLVLELMLPHSIAANLTNQELLDLLWQHVVDFVAYLLSFWMISIYWRSHFDFFECVPHIHSKVISLNTIFLLTLTLIPFPSQLMSHYNNSLGLVLFNISIGLPAVIMALMFKVVHGTAGTKEHMAQHYQSHQHDFGIMVMMSVFTVLIAVLSYFSSSFMYLWFVTKLFNPLRIYLARWLPKL